MVEVKQYLLPPTPLIPNSPRPILHYPGLLVSSQDDQSDEACTPARVHDILRSNGWQMQWIYRYGQTQTSHYHSRVHECMAVLSGEATIRFGVADIVTDLNELTNGPGQEEGGIKVHARKGDVFILPAGVAHKTYDAIPSAEFALLTPGDGHHIASLKKGTTMTDSESDDVRNALAQIVPDGFTMVGAYPDDSAEWNFAKGGEDEGQYETVWAVAKPSHDPVLGDAPEGICGQWK